MRVLMTADAVGGVWTYALELARGLARQRNEISLAVMGPAPSLDQWREALAIPGLDLHHASYKLEWMDDPWRDVDDAGEWLRTLARREAPEIVHLNGYAHATVPFAAPKIVVGHSCVLSWWQAVHGEPAPPPWDEYRNRVSRGLHAADLVIAPSQAMMNSLVEHYGELPSRRVIPNGRNAAQFQLSAKEDFVLTAGRFWDQAKNLTLLDSIANSLAWPVFAAGEGGKASNLTCLGPLSHQQIAQWFTRAPIYALPARYEPFGLSVLEAALSGCALVLGDIPSLRENWDGAALFAPPDRARDWIAQLRVLIESDETRVKFQNAALARARNFSAQRMTDSYIDSYAALLRRSQPAAALRS